MLWQVAVKVRHSKNDKGDSPSLPRSLRRRPHVQESNHLREGFLGGVDQGEWEAHLGLFDWLNEVPISCRCRAGQRNTVVLAMKGRKWVHHLEESEMYSTDSKN
jgi:hypothetical protein